MDVRKRYNSNIQYFQSNIQILRGTFQIAKLFNIPVLVHWSFGLIIFWVMYIGGREGLDTKGMLWLGVFMLALFVCVILHEFGHALTARRYGVETRDIIISPIGGVARLNKLPENPLHEFFVAIAGPLVNVAIALLLLPYLFWLAENNVETIGELLTRVLTSFPEKLQFRDYFIPVLALLNISLAIFNLIPAFPMDGGRILRSLLALKFSRLTATKYASYLGRFFAALFVVYGLYSGSFITALIGIFIYTMAANELRMVKVDDALQKSTVGDVMRIDFTKQYENSPISEVIKDTQNGEEKNFLVFNFHDELTGILSQSAIIQAIRDKKMHYQVADYQLPVTDRLYESDNLKNTFDKMQREQISIVPVFTIKDELMGVMDVQSINHYLRHLQKKR
ncbi:MAG: site-2 protease family protein [Saprospiraceae bacterium]